MEKREKRQARKKTPRPKRALKQSQPVSIKPGKSQVGRFRQLARAIAAAPNKSTGITHAECEAALEFYVDSEQRGEDTHKLYPAVARHLGSCEQCSRSYALLAEQETSPPDVHSNLVPDDMASLPFLSPSAPNETWTRHVRSPIGGGQLGFGFAFQPKYIQQVFGPNSPALLTRGPLDATSKSLLLSDTISLGRREVAITIWAWASNEPGQTRLEGEVASSVALPDPLRVILKWNHHELASQVENTKFSFEGLDTTDLEHASEMRVEFEAGTASSVGEE